MISFLPRIKTFGDLSVVATHGLFLSRRSQQKKHKSSSNRTGGAMNPPSKPSERPIHPIFLRSASAAKTKSGRFFVTLLPIRFFRPRQENVRLRQTQQHKYSREQPAPQKNDAGSPHARHLPSPLDFLRPTYGSAKKRAMPFAASPLPLYQNSYRIFLMISPPCLIASSFCGSIFHAR